VDKLLKLMASHVTSPFELQSFVETWPIAYPRNKVRYPLNAILSALAFWLYFLLSLAALSLSTLSLSAKVSAENEHERLMLKRKVNI
jgi:hypothetical protein